MLMNRCCTTALIAVGVLWLGLSVAAQSSEKYKATLQWVPIDSANQAFVAGSGSVTAELVGTKLTITGTFTGLRSPATIAQLHRAPNIGIRGPVVADLIVSKETGGTLSGSVELTPAQLPNFKKGWFYVQIHSEKAPDGNLWGWLLPEANRK